MKTTPPEVRISHDIEDVIHEVSMYYSEIRGLKKLTGGYSNIIYEFQNHNEKYILKCLISDKQRSLGKNSSLKNEVEALEYIRSHSDIKVPRVFNYSFEESSRQYFVMEKIEGNKPKFGEKVKCNTSWESIGYVLAELHKLEPQDSFRAGYICDRINGTWYDFLQIKINELNKKTKWVNNFSKIIQEYKDILINVKTTFVHGDIWENNVLLTKEHHLALIDLEYGMIGDPLMDFLLFFLSEKKINKNSCLINSYNKYAKDKIECNKEENIRFFICNGLYALQILIFLESLDKGVSVKNYLILKMEAWYLQQKCMRGIKQINKIT